MADDLTDLATEHAQALMRLAYLLTSGDRALSDDLVQATLLRLTTRGVSDLDHPLAYARRVLTNAYRDHVRSESTWRRFAPRLVEADLGPDPSEVSAEREAVLAALRVLSPRERAVVVLRYYEDRPDDEIATALGCRRATVRSLAHRALPKLRAQLESEEVCSPDRPVGLPTAPRRHDPEEDLT